MKITEPIHVGALQLRSRLVVPPMATQSTESGIPGAWTTQHDEAFAENPLVGLLITEFLRRLVTRG